MTAPPNDRPLSIAILAGGGSTRMGADKASIEVAGRTMLDRVTEASALTGLQTFVVGRAPDASWATALPVVADRRPGEGPLAGLEAALLHAETDVLLLGCDMPWVTTAALEWLIDRADGGVVASRERLEPLFSVYPLDALPTIGRSLDAGRRSLTRLIEELELEICRLPRALWRSLDDADEPSDLEPHDD